MSAKPVNYLKPGVETPQNSQPSSQQSRRKLNAARPKLKDPADTTADDSRKRQASRPRLNKPTAPPVEMEEGAEEEVDVSQSPWYVRYGTLLTVLLLCCLLSAGLWLWITTKTTVAAGSVVSGGAGAGAIGSVAAAAVPAGASDAMSVFVM